jgi:hypothetical protein
MLGGHLQRRPQHTTRRVADENVELAEFLPNGLEHFRDGRQVGNVSLEVERSHAQRFQCLTESLGLVGAAEVVDTDPAAGARQPPADCLADATGATGDQSCLAFKRSGFGDTYFLSFEGSLTRV